MRGTAYGVGVGPGDPELMTLKAVRLIRENHVIAVPVSGAGRDISNLINEVDRGDRSNPAGKAAAAVHAEHGPTGPERLRQDAGGFPAGDGRLRMGHDGRPADRNRQDAAGADPDDLEAPV